MDAVIPVIYGAYAAGFLVAAAFFLRFWSRMKAPLFLVFAIAFALLALSYGLLGAVRLTREELSGVYLIRLAAFVLIIAGIVWTNLRDRR